MQSLQICILFAVICFTSSSKISSRAQQGGDEVLIKNISDLHFQLFSSVQKKTKMIKSAVFETQCSGSGCTFNGCQSSESGTCDGKMLSKLNQIHSSIRNIWKRKPEKPSTVCKKGWKRHNNHCYFLSSAKLNWFEAQMFCRNLKTTLVQINDANESKWLSRNFPKVPYWLDVTDVGKEGHWLTFSTGKRPTFTSWDRGQPDNWKKNQDCGYNNFSGRLGRWDDAHCTMKIQFICEESGSGF
ncbi:perlucin-like protein [Ostrea edulis]|uniref:perlucin-like protein n=1 Tax=Ostrea edulis TaxID=37623 RepID=UPI0024AFEA9C|nr:perlucin-like protein [Ostrea edulis]